MVLWFYGQKISNDCLRKYGSMVLWSKKIYGSMVKKTIVLLSENYSSMVKIILDMVGGGLVVDGEVGEGVAVARLEFEIFQFRLIEEKAVALILVERDFAILILLFEEGVVVGHVEDRT